MRRKNSLKASFWYRNSLTLVFLSFGILTLCGQAVTGWHVHNEALEEKAQPALDFLSYLGSGHFIEATFENWESEFLQMGLFVIFTIFLRQQGSSESKSLDNKEEVDRKPVNRPGAPWPVRKGGIVLAIYKYSLSIAFLLLFLISFALHTYGSWQNDNEEKILDGETPLPLSSYLGEAKFWFESLQNWQSEFISIAAIIFFSIYLRQQGSSQSKPVDAPHMGIGE